MKLFKKLIALSLLYTIRFYHETRESKIIYDIITKNLFCESADNEKIAHRQLNAKLKNTSTPQRNNFKN